MDPLSSRSKVVSNKKMSFWEKIYLPAVLNGMRITFSHLVRKKTTIRYPEKVREFSEIYRGRHVLKRDDEGRERCTACGLCAVACPAEAITMVAAERQPAEEMLYREEKYAAVYEIDMLRCIFCGLCEEDCPKEAIFLTKRIISSDYGREGFFFSKEKLLEPRDHAQRIDVSKRETQAVLDFKKDKTRRHNR
jgi:NADH-quinone oxidoreductase subunit I